MHYVTFTVIGLCCTFADLTADVPKSEAQPAAEGGARTEHAREETIAILPLEDKTNSPDFEWVRESVPAAMATDLKRLYDFTVLPLSEASHQYQLAQFGSTNEREQIRRTAARLGVEALIYGNFTLEKEKNRIVIHCNLYLAASDSSIPISDISVPLSAQMFSAISTTSEVLALDIEKYSTKGKAEGQLSGKRSFRTLPRLLILPQRSSGYSVAANDKIINLVHAQLATSVAYERIDAQGEVTEQDIAEGDQTLQETADKYKADYIVIIRPGPISERKPVALTATVYRAMSHKLLQSKTAEAPNTELVSILIADQVALQLRDISFAVSGKIEGLTGAGFRVSLNNGPELPLSQNGEFSFAAKLKNHEKYELRIVQQPAGPAQECVILNGSGVIRLADVENIRLLCSAKGFALGGNLSGLAGGKLTLLLNGVQALDLTGNGSFRFREPVEDKTPYRVEVRHQPDSPPQICSLAAPAGMIAGKQVDNLAITCRKKVLHSAFMALGYAPVTAFNASNNTIVADGYFPYGQLYSTLQLSLGYMNAEWLPYRLILGGFANLWFGYGSADLVYNGDTAERGSSFRFTAWELAPFLAYEVYRQKNLSLMPLAGFGISYAHARWPSDGLTFYKSWSLYSMLGGMVKYRISAHVSLLGIVRNQIYFVQSNLMMTNSIAIGGEYAL